MRTRVEKDFEQKTNIKLITFSLEEGVYRCTTILQSEFILETDRLTIQLKSKERGVERAVVKNKVFSENKMEVVFDLVVVDDRETFTLDYLIERGGQYQNDPIKGSVIFFVREIFNS